MMESEPDLDYEDDLNALDEGLDEDYVGGAMEEDGTGVLEDADDLDWSNTAQLEVFSLVMIMFDIVY